MNKEQLSQVYYINKEIELLKKQIESTKHDIVTDSVKGSSIDFPYTQHNIIITGVDTKSYDRKINRLRAQLSQRLEDLMDKVAEINEYIASINDSEMRMILSLRYVNNLTWQQIAAHIGTIGDGSTERKKHDRFLIISHDSRNK